MAAQAEQRAPLVLVVEDEPILRIYATDWLEDAGFEVIDAHDAAGAISLLEERDDIRLVFTDISMPGDMDGMKLAAYIRKRWPPIALVITSGASTPRFADLPAGSVFFGKPYQREKVEQAIRKLLA